MSNKDIREQRATLKSVLQGPPGCKTLAKSYEDKYNKLYIDNKDTLFICCKICKELIKCDRQTSKRNIDNHYNKHTAGSAGSKRPASNQLALIPSKRLDQKSEELSATQKKAINDSLMRNVISALVEQSFLYSNCFKTAKRSLLSTEHLDDVLQVYYSDKLNK